MKIKNYLSFCLKSFLDFIIIRLSELQIFIERRFIKENEYNFDDLTPNIKETELKENQKTYLKSLKWAVLNENINNVALTGFYGTGKSTILNTFLKKNKGFKNLHISLSKFSDNDYEDSHIEIAILQQIFYSKKQYILPDSRLKRIKNNKYLFPKAIGFFCWLISFLYIFYPSALITVLHRNYFLNSTFYKYLPYNNLIAISLIVWFIIGLVIIVKKSLKEILNLKLNKLSVKDVELISKDDKDNLLNKNIDEIIYFFEKTKVKVVIIEDLDRFNNPSILIKLREINSLINNCEDIDDKVTFIYAIKDEMFTQDNNRAKFFDFIIPLIPIINYDNSYEILTKKLSDYENITDDFYKNISPYINDMRMLKNIVNEFKVYQNILGTKKNDSFKTIQIQTIKKRLNLPYFNTIEIEKGFNNVLKAPSNNDQENFDNQKLLSLIIYKNYYPKDFTNLQLQQGILYTIFNKKEELFKDIIDKKEIEIEKIKEIIEIIDSEKTKEIITLRRLYIYELFKELHKNNINDAKQILDKGIKLDDDSLLTDINFYKLIESENIKYSSYLQENYWENYALTTNISFKKIETNVNKDFKYLERENLVKEKLENKISSLNKSISKLKVNIKEIKYLDIYEAGLHVEFNILDNYINNILSEIKDSDENNENYNLFKTFLIEGYINENYIDYISYFHDGSLTTNDNDLKKKIIEQKVIPFDAKIDNVKRLVEKLAESNFKKTSILNYEILEYLIDEGYYIQLELFIETISEDDFEVFEFIKGYLIYLKNNDLKKDKIIPFIDIMINRNELFWEFLCKNNLEKEIKDEVLVMILTLGSNENLTQQDSNNILSDYINNSEDFLEIFKNGINEDEIIKSLKHLRIKFKNITYNDTTKSLFEKIYKNDLYEINSKMIYNILNFNRTNYPEADKEYIEEDIYNSNCTTIIESKIPELINYINNNIKVYLENVFFKLESNESEKESTIITLLKNSTSDLDFDIKSEIIKKQKAKISNIEDVSDDLWKVLIENNKLMPSWENLIVYFKESGDFESLVDYLNTEENYNELSQTYIDEGEDEFIKGLINSDISDESFHYLVRSIDKKYDDISILEVTNLNRISTLINSIKINLTDLNIQYLFDNDSNEKRLYITLIELNEELFFDTFNQFVLNNEIINNLIVNSTLSEKTVEKIIIEYDAKINLFDANKLSNIAEYLSDANIIDFSHELYINLMTHSSESAVKTKLLNLHFSTLNEDDLFESLNLIGEPFSKIQSKENFEIINNSENLRLLELLKGKYIRTIYQKRNGNLSVAYSS